MPPVKPRDMDDTWNPAELEKSMKGSKDDKKRRDKDRDRRKEKTKDDEERKHRRKKEDVIDGVRKTDKERRHHDKDNVPDKRDRDKDRDKDRDRERRHRDKENADEKNADRERRRRKREEAEGDDRKHRRKQGGEKDGERDGRHRKHKEESEADDERQRRRDERRKQDGDGKERRKHRDEDDVKKRHKALEDGHMRLAGTGLDKVRHQREDSERRRVADHSDGDRRPDGRLVVPEERPRQHREKDEVKEEKEKEENKSAAKAEEADEYDDDFEDYEEDFEEDDEDNDDDHEEIDNKINEKEKIQTGVKSRSEMDDILKAMDAENNRLLKDSQEPERDQHPEKGSSSMRPATGKRPFINFVSAKQRQASSKAAQRTHTRGRHLLNLIELDRVSFDLFDMPPVSEYELYMRSFGRSDTRQRYIQTNEDNVEKDVQTEDIETVEKWVQWPPEDTKGCGGDKMAEEEEASKPINTGALTKFVQNAGQAILILLEESRLEANQSDSSKKRSTICLSEAFSELEPPPFFKGRCVSYTCFSEAQTHMLLTVHDKPDTPADGEELSSKGAICVWNVNEPSYPQKVLLCEGDPRCCCFSPVSATLVFAGMVDGSVAVWDLREANSQHRQLSRAGSTWALRHPTYNTAGVLHYENHLSAVTSVLPIHVPGDHGDSDVEGSASFQLATVEENATVHLWVVAEIAHPDPAGSQLDLGLSPGGRIKLIKSSAICLPSPVRNVRLRTSLKAFEMKLLPADPSHFYVGTDTGHIIHGVRFGGKAPPRAYKADIDSPLEVTSLDFSPFTEPVFLAGCADGSVRLYHVNNAAPVLVWDGTTGGRAVLTVRWCRSRPCVFFVLDDASRLYIWDLLMSDAVPMKEEVISTDRLTSFCLSNDFAATGLGVPGRKPAMVVSFETGRVEVHTMSQQFSALMPEEIDQFAQFLAQCG